MNWILYSIISLAKIITVCGLVLLSIIAVPLIASIFLLGMSLAYLRDNEPENISDTKQFTFSFPQWNVNLFYICSSGLVRVQHALVKRNKSNF